MLQDSCVINSALRMSDCIVYEWAIPFGESGRLHDFQVWN